MSDLVDPQFVATFFGFISICYGINALKYPDDFANDFGYPFENPSVASDVGLWPQNLRKPFVVATGGRTIALGAAITLLAWDGQVRAAGTVICSCALSGLIDAVNCYREASPGLAQHAIGTVVLATMGMWLRSK